MIWYQLGWCCYDAVQQVYLGLSFNRQLVIEKSKNYTTKSTIGFHEQIKLSKIYNRNFY